MRGLRIVLLCLALGVAVIAAVGTLRAAIDRGLAARWPRILGGDLEVEGGSQPLPDALRDWLRARGATLSDVVQMRSMLVAPSGERQLVELKAVDAAWPLVGATVPSRPHETWPTALARKAERRGGRTAGGARRAATASACTRAIPFGWATPASRVRGALTSEPDRVATPSIFGPRVLIAAAALPRPA